MCRRRMFILPVLTVLAGGLWCAAEPPASPPKEDPKTEPAVKSKELSANVKKGLEWLIKQQNENGSWGQGEESAQMGGGNALKASPNVADTCMAAMALLRAGNTPKTGEYSKQLNKALEFVCKQIEKSDEKGMSVTDLLNTRTQQKLGQHIDTFMSANLLAEVWKDMPDEAGAKMAKAAFHKVMDKIEKNQQKDGTWAQGGWAPGLAEGQGAKTLNVARASGYKVNEDVRARAEDRAKKEAKAQGQVRADGKLDKPLASDVLGKSAGVELYARASALQGLQWADTGNVFQADELNVENEKHEKRLSELAGGAKPVEEGEAGKLEENLKKNKERLAAIKDNREALERAQQAVLARMQDKAFVAGFGSNGGEEFLSHLNIGESLVAKGGADWEKWDKQMTENLNRIQNQDGSWTGHHCITGRTFCTSAALLVLMVDRCKTPVAKKIAKR